VQYLKQTVVLLLSSFVEAWQKKKKEANGVRIFPLWSINIKICAE